MRKKVFGRKFSRSKKSREALFRSLIRALVVSGSIETTKAKAKAISGQIDKLVSDAKIDSLAKRRAVLAYLANDKVSTKILFNKVAPVFSQRKSGFTKIILLPPRKGDGAEMARIEWVERIGISNKEISDKSRKDQKPEAGKIVQKPKVRKTNHL